MSVALSARLPFVYSCTFGNMITYFSREPLHYKWRLSTDYCDEFNRERLRIENFISINSFLFHRSLYKKEGGFDEKLEYLEDWDLIRRYAQHADFGFVPKTTAIYMIPFDSEGKQMRQSFLDDAYQTVYQKPISY